MPEESNIFEGEPPSTFLLAEFAREGAHEEATSSPDSNEQYVLFRGAPSHVPPMLALRTCFRKRTPPLSAEPLRHMWSTLGGVGGAIAL